ncbi:protein AGENET DOMAIN (AGD)-CONTAINING P1 [Ziziphus jujuba]|uniref:Protein AGENET DOMAIN (AGD)-CONTAINING P1 n=1 Tax=Ziziphus jujuba TaxID=326968 RepID=A0A6P3ZNN5_ZIZJJ|nr:protein AGENET DOMAIN (AGD)-CONTAINING P1 [Ziziphus jujuba]
MAFTRGEEVEVCSKEDGFLGSYYAATIVSRLDNGMYIVKYKDLLENDESRPLVETVFKHEVRPVPPEIVSAAAFAYLDKVDAFANDGWWVGKITAKQGSDYYVYFETTGDEIAYPVSHLRFHLDWRFGKWISSKKSLLLRSSASPSS